MRIKQLVLLLFLIVTLNNNAQEKANKKKYFYGGTVGVGVSKLWYPTLYTNIKTENKLTKTIGFDVFIGKKVFKYFETQTKLKHQQFNLFTQNSKFDKQTLASTVKLNNYLTISNYFIIEQSLRWTYHDFFSELGLGMGFHINSKTRVNKNEFIKLDYSPFIPNKYSLFYSIGLGYIIINKSDFKINSGLYFSPPLNHEIQAFTFRIQIQKHF